MDETHIAFAHEVEIASDSVAIGGVQHAPHTRTIPVTGTVSYLITHDRTIVLRHTAGSLV